VFDRELVRSILLQIDEAIDAEQVFWILKHNLVPLSAIVKKMIEEIT
jgi:hypothetical protein